VEISFDLKDYEVKKYLTIQDQLDIIDFYSKVYFGKSGIEMNYFKAELEADSALLQVCLGIDVPANEKFYLFMDNVYSSDLINRLKLKVVNYNDFFFRLESAISKKEEYNNSFRGIFDGVLSSIGDLDGEKVKNALDSLKNLQDEMKDSPFKDLMAEAKYETK